MTRKFPTVGLFCSLWLLIGCGSSSGLLAVGTTAPNFVGADQAGQVQELTLLRQSRPAVLYFYPRDGTPGCTREACAFRDAWTDIQATGAVVIGVSTDSVDSHARFAQEHELPFSLISDPNGEILQQYGVGRMIGMASRVTFIVGTDGRITHVYPDVDPAVHAREVIRALETLN